jgi:MFS family permease
MQGFGGAIIVITAPTMIVSAFPNHKQEYMSYYVMTISLGMLIGPVVGAFVFEFLGYAGTFYFFSSSSILTAIIAQYYVPKSVNALICTTKNREVEISFMRFFKNKITCL